MSTYGPPQPHDVVTGEAVALELRLAQLPTRALALMIDMIIQVVLLFGLFLLLSAGGGSLDDAAGAALSLVVIVGVLVGYPLVLETLTRGRTVGKYAPRPARGARRRRVDPVPARPGPRPHRVRRDLAAAGDPRAVLLVGEPQGQAVR